MSAWWVGTSPTGLERSRSMFERLMKEVPTHHALIFYFTYAEFEEEHGLYSHAIDIYDRMVKAVLPSEKFKAYSIYIAKATKLLRRTQSSAACALPQTHHRRLQD